MEAGKEPIKTKAPVKVAFISFLTLLILGCSSEMPADVSFSGEVVPILESNCTKCHIEGRTPLDLIPGRYYSDLVAGGYVVKFDATTSPLYNKLKDGHSLLNILSPRELATVKIWIDEGALDN
jgi:hypothetical protein